MGRVTKSPVVQFRTMALSAATSCIYKARVEYQTTAAETGNSPAGGGDPVSLRKSGFFP